MQINELIETPEGLHKKIVALQAMIDDPSTTQGEKDNAATLMQKVKAKLAKEFPNFVPSAAKPTSARPRSDWFHDMATGYGKAMDKEAEEIRRYGKPMNVSAMLSGEGVDGKKYTWSEDEVLPFVKQLREKGKHYRKQWISGYDGNVDYKPFYAKAKKLIEKWCPITAAKEKEKELKAYKSADARADKIWKEKQTAKDAAQKASGITTKEAVKIDPELVKRANTSMSGQPLANNSNVRGGTWKTSMASGTSFFWYLRNAKATSIKQGIGSLGKEDAKKLYDIVSKIATTGGEYAYTEAQKNFVLAALKSII